MSLACAQAAMKRRYDAKHRKLEFKPGDWAWLQLGKGYSVADGEPLLTSAEETSLNKEKHENKVNRSLQSFQYISLHSMCHGEIFR